ncbi:SDR family oxidoreductase [Chelativorans sp. ZYF759]|uniref:SDR family oxidoreductase n=1 Tax=Chelativorans sp. ZYF759 TaxID=2692213 RepID=UPI00145CCA7A|nr:SDR family oxidoreductase [Chelativorans sp. ZYF759]
MTDLFDISGKVAVVTGGANGLGRMIAEGLVDAGATVYITSRKQADAEGAAEQMFARGRGRCIGLTADLSTPEAAADLARVVSEREPKVHILVNNAGRTWGAPLESFPDKAWPGVLAVNVQTPFTLVRELLPALRNAANADDPARIINIGSVAGAAAERLSAYSYAASKAAIHHLSKVLAADLASDSITVNALLPGYFPTQMTSHIRAEEEKLSELIERVPLGRLGSAADIAGACIFLASKAGAYVTGTQLSVDGGMLGCR